MNEAQSMAAPASAPPTGHSGSHMLWGAVLFLIGLLIGGGLVWFYGPTTMAPGPTESASPSPTAEAREGEATKGEAWTRFVSDYGFSFEYPIGLRPPLSMCGGMGVAPGPAELCREVSISSVLEVQEFAAGGSLNDSVNVRVVDSEGLGAEEYAAALLADSVVIEPLVIATLGRVSGYRAVFSGPLFHDAHEGGGALYDAESILFVADAGGGNVIRVTYPRQFCMTYRYSAELDRILSFEAECYSDDRASLYHMIADTLTLE